MPSISVFRKLDFAQPLHRTRTARHRGFTFVELLIAITVMALTFMPIMGLFTSAMEQIHMTNEVSSALNLGREGMEMIRNLNLPTETLRQMKNDYYPPLDQDPIYLNRNAWRIRTVIHETTLPLQVDIEIWREPHNEKVLTLTTLFEDLIL